MGLFAAFIDARCVSHVKNDRICERKLFVAMRGEGGGGAERGVSCVKRVRERHIKHDSFLA